MRKANPQQVMISWRSEAGEELFVVYRCNRPGHGVKGGTAPDVALQAVAGYEPTQKTKVRAAVEAAAQSGERRKFCESSCIVFWIIANERTLALPFIRVNQSSERYPKPRILFLNPFLPLFLVCILLLPPLNSVPSRWRAPGGAVRC